MSTDQYETRGGIRVRRTVDDIPMANAIEPLIDALDARRGALLASNYEYPGPLHALGHRVRRSAARAGGARPRASASRR